MARAPKAEGEKKQTRPVGPKTLYAIFKPGTDPALVAQFKEAIGEMTMNGRALLKSLQGGNPSPFLTFTVHVEPKNKGEAEAAS